MVKICIGVTVEKRLQNRYTALLLAHVCACVTGLQHVQWHVQGLKFPNPLSGEEAAR